MEPEAAVSNITFIYFQPRGARERSCDDAHPTEVDGQKRTFAYSVSVRTLRPFSNALLMRFIFRDRGPEKVIIEFACP
jgi:hypothetical protein